MAFTPRPSECKADTSRAPTACQAQGRPGRPATVGQASSGLGLEMGGRDCGFPLHCFLLSRGPCFLEAGAEGGVSEAGPPIPTLLSDLL